jgi:hypothetical protein
MTVRRASPIAASPVAASPVAVPPASGARPARLAAFGLAFAVSFGRGAPAFAADAPTPPSPSAPSPDVKAEARERFDRGLHLFEKGENTGALAEFKRAYQLIPNPLVLYNMGLVYAATSRPVDAVDTLTQFLADPGTASGEEKAHATSVRDEQQKRVSQLVVLTDHPATVEVDGVEVGHTPLVAPLRVASGSHVVAIEAAGFLGSRREVTLAGQLTETIAMSMEPTDTRMAQLVVTTGLPGAEVLVNGKRVGATPLPASVAVAPGKVKVELQRAGYVTGAQTIALDEGARGELTFTLEEDPGAPPSLRGRLVVTTDGPDAEISVDGTPHRPLAGPIGLPVGPHHVRLERLGYEAAERSVEVVNGQDALLVVALTPTADTQAQLEASQSRRRIVGWSLLAGGLAVAAGGAVFAIVSNGQLSTDQKALDANVTVPWADMTNVCHIAGSSAFNSHGCGDVLSSYQDPVDNDKLKRTIGIIGGAVGVVAAGVGGYLLATTGSSEAAASTTTTARGLTVLTAWTAGPGTGGVLAGGRF